MSDLYENYIMDVEEIGKEDTKMLPESRQIEQKYLGNTTAALHSLAEGLRK
jgi:hypothetical protein